MNATYYEVKAKKEAYKRDNRAMLIAGIVAVLIAYFILTRPSYPTKTFTWGDLLTVYGVAFYMGASFVAGWRVLHNFTAQFFLFLPLVGWLIYFFIKVSFALLIGAHFYGIYRFLNNCWQIHQLNKTTTD